MYLGSPVGATPESQAVRESPDYLVAPFSIVAIVAEASLVLSPGRDSLAATISSVFFLLLTVASFGLFAKTSRGDWTHLLVPLFYTASVLSLVIAAGSASPGVGLVMLLAVLWTAIYLEIWKSLIVISGVVISELVLTIVPADLSDSIRLRRVLIYLLVSSLVVYVLHELRSRLARISAQREVLNGEMVVTIGALEETLRSASVLAHLVDMLNSCNNREEAYEVMDHAARQTFGAGGSVSAYDSAENQLDTKCAWGKFPLERPPFSTDDCWALRHGHEYESRAGEISCEHLRDSGEVHTLCRPLLAQGEIMGVLTISIPDLDIPMVRTAGYVDPLPQTALLFGEQISIWMANFKLREILLYQSVRDPLTKLFNRRMMEETLARELSKANRTFDEVSVIQIDIDHFKEFNDRYGHAVGDSALVAIADVILSLFRDSDVPCRSGGEEFTLLLPTCTWAIAETRSAELQRRVAELRLATPIGQVPLHPPTLSIGIATSPEHGSTSESLLIAADVALYAAKTAGRNRISRAIPVVVETVPDAWIADGRS
jgi:diguanylate cyclase (GGDEF)-like protein